MLNPDSIFKYSDKLVHHNAPVVDGYRPLLFDLRQSQTDRPAGGIVSREQKF